MLHLSNKWAPILVSQPETGMTYQVARVTLKDGSRYESVMIVEGVIIGIRGRADIPFGEDEIADIHVTHDKWDWSSETWNQ